MQGYTVGGVESNYLERAKKSGVGIATNRVPITSVLWEGITSNFYFILQAFFWREKEGGSLKMKRYRRIDFYTDRGWMRQAVSGNPSRG